MLAIVVGDKRGLGGVLQSQQTVMIWAVFLLLGVIAAVHWFDYQRSVQEYTIAQPATLEDVRGVIGDKTPVVVEIGALPWRPEVAGIAAWTVSVAGPGASIGEDDGSVLNMPVGTWLKEPASGRAAIVNGSALAEEMGLTTGLSELEESRAFWWMPGLADPAVGILDGGGVTGLTWVGAERRWFGCSGGAPVVLWLVHSRYRRYLPEEGSVDPWSLTVAEAPWIGRVQFVEVRVRPGWCLGIPAHWGYAVKSEGEGSGGESWWWSADQHSPLSRLLTSV